MGALKAIPVIFYFGLGFVQMFATIAGFEVWFDVHWIIAFIIATLISYIPVVGTVAGIYGAVTAWSWSWTGAVALFVGPWAFFLLLTLVLSAAGAVTARRG